MLFYIIIGVLSVIFGEFLYISFLKIRLNESRKQNDFLKNNLNAVQMELKNAKEAKKIRENTYALSNDDVDEFLRDGGYFRQ